jgi:Fe-S cluster biogenesis protein NfuA
MRRSLRHHFLRLRGAETPNPNSFSFQIPSGQFELFIPEGMTCDVPHRSLSFVHPFSDGLFAQYEKEVSSIFIAPRYVTVTKFPQVSWEDVEWSISSFIGHYLYLNAQCAEPVPEYKILDDDTKLLPDDSEVVQCIKEIVREQVRPMVQKDGGDVKYLNFNSKTGIVSLAMLGACRTCPSSKVTLKDGIERILRHFLPEVTEVVEVKGNDFHQDYELKFRNEKALREEAARIDRERQRKAKIFQSGQLLTFDALNEPDGD